MTNSESSKVLIVIPARFASVRFPGKPLAEILGKPMIQYVLEGARQAKQAAKVLGAAVVVPSPSTKIFASSVPAELPVSKHLSAVCAAAVAPSAPVIATAHLHRAVAIAAASPMIAQSAAPAAAANTAAKSDYISQMRAAGYNVDLDKYIAMKIQGVTP